MNASPKTVLLVEDDQYDVLFVKKEFEKSPHHTRLRSVRDGVEAMQYVEGRGQYADRQQFPPPDLILLDLRMPRMGGLEFLDWLRWKCPDPHRMLPVVVLCGSGLQEDEARTRTLGANAHLTKPLAWETFREQISALGIKWSACDAPTLEA